MQGLSKGYPLNRSRGNCQSGETYLFPLMHHGACVVAFILLIIMHIPWCNKVCNKLLECGSWFASMSLCCMWLSTFVTDCLNVHMNVVRGLPMIVCMSWGTLFHTACTIFRCLHDNTRLSETCKRTSRH